MLVRKGGQLTHAACAGHNTKGGRRLGIVKLAAHDQRVFGIAREGWAYLRHLVAHVLHGLGHVGGQRKLGPDLGAAFQRVAENIAHAVHSINRFFQRLDQVCLYLFG